MKKSTIILAACASLLFTACSKYEPSPNMAKLNVSFADSKWDGKNIPKDETCLKYNSDGGNTPSLVISNLPKNTNKLILTFTDNNPSAKMLNGGHGIISYKIDKYSKKIIVPSIKGQTFTLPSEFNSIKAHRGSKWGNKVGAYLPPCSGGRNNPYEVLVEAIHEYSSTDKKPMLLGEKRLPLGRY